MELSELYREFGQILYDRYNAVHSVDVYHQEGYNTVNYNLRFGNSESFGNFLKELTQLKEMDEERILRQSNPVIQRAYDEYKLLLKLSK